MKTSMLALIGIVVAALLYLGWMNRASEKIISTYLSALVALCAVLFVVFVFGAESQLTARFPVAFFAYQSNRAPIHIPFRPDLDGYYLIAELQKNDPQVMKGEDNGQALYHEFLQKVIIDSLAFRYAGNWDVDVVRYRTSGTSLTTYPGSATEMQRFMVTDLERALGNNRFAKEHLMPVQLSLPPNSKLKVTAPNAATQRQGVIEITNPFVTIRITTRPLWFQAGLGDYRLMTDLPVGEDQKMFCGFTYELQVSATFSRIRSGHPDMPKYKKWASQIIAELGTDFNEEEILEDAKHRYLFAKQAVHFGAQLLPDGIMGFSPPQRQ